MLLIDYAREVAGLPCRGLHIGIHIGRTLDEGKAALMREAGATVQTHTALNTGRVIEYEINFPVGAAVQADVA